jgi:acyl carrier protein
MERPEIQSKIKQIISHVAGIPAQKIGDEDAFRDDLNLDSLSLLEIGVDVDFNFKLGLPDERYKEIGSVAAMVELVEQRLAEMASAVPA